MQRKSTSFDAFLAGLILSSVALTLALGSFQHWALGLMAVLLLVGWWAGSQVLWSEPNFIFRWSLGAFLVLSFVIIATQHTGSIQGRFYAWLEDDAMVSMQFAKQLVQGHGLVWAQGQRVEGFSNPAWTLGMAAAVALLPRDAAPLALLLLNVALGAAFILALRRLALALGASALPAALAAVGAGLSFELLWAVASGMESVAVALTATLAFASLAEARRDGRPAPLKAFALAGLLGVLRIDGALPLLLILVLGWPGLQGARRWQALALALLPVLGWQAFRLGYYGAWVPNTVMLKAGTWPGRWTKGLAYVLRVDYQSRLALLLALTALWPAALRRWWALLLLLLAYGLVTGGDIYPGTRYLAPAWGLLWALAAASAEAWAGKRRAGLLLAFAAAWSYHGLWAFPGLMQGGWSEARDRILMAQRLDQVVQPGQRVAAAWAGSFYYYSDAQGVDLLGKCDPVVAAAAPDPASGVVGHNKMDLEHSLGRLRPDWVITLPPGQPGAAAWSHADYDNKVWMHPLFQAHCQQREAGFAGPWMLCHCRWP